MKQNDHTGDLKTSENSRSFLVTRVQHHWVSLLCRKLFIQNAPENPRDFLVRPEVRAMYEVGRDWKSPRNGMMIHQYHPLSTMTHIFKMVEPTLGRSKIGARPFVRAPVHSDGPCMSVSKQMARRNRLENWFQDCCAKLRENDVPLKISKISHPRMLKMRNVSRIQPTQPISRSSFNRG